jgi:hypothetical protein
MRRSTLALSIVGAAVLVSTSAFGQDVRKKVNNTQNKTDSVWEIFDLRDPDAQQPPISSSGSDYIVVIEPLAVASQQNCTTMNEVSRHDPDMFDPNQNEVSRHDPDMFNPNQNEVSQHDPDMFNPHQNEVSRHDPDMFNPNQNEVSHHDPDMFNPNQNNVSQHDPDMFNPNQNEVSRHDPNTGGSCSSSQ